MVREIVVRDSCAGRAGVLAGGWCGGRVVERVLERLVVGMGWCGMGIGRLRSGVGGLVAGLVMVVVVVVVVSGLVCAD